MSNLKAFQATIPSLGGDGGIVLEASAGKARYSAYLNAKDVWPGVTLTEVRVKRAPEYDQSVMVGGHPLKPGRCYGKEYLSEGGGTV